MECLDCGLGFVNPRPTREEIKRYYPTEYYADFSENHSYRQRRYAREASYLEDVPRGDSTRRLLDIGCAHGDFPRFMRQRGWEVEGVEVSATTSPIHDFAVYAVISSTPGSSRSGIMPSRPGPSWSTSTTRPRFP